MGSRDFANKENSHRLNPSTSSILFSIFVFLLPCTILSFFQPLTLNFPSVMAFSALLICLFRILIQEFETLVSLAQHMQDRKVSGLRVWRNIVPDIETDRVFLVSRPMDK